MQRAAVLLVKAFEHTYAEAAEVLGVRPSSVQKHLERALVKLRSELGVTIDD
jgi:DNA-directed RNA polymerase specialized sigma24 family protein